MKTLLALLLLATASLGAPTLAWDANPPEEQIIHYDVMRRTGAAPYVYTSIGTTAASELDLAPHLLPGANTFVVVAVNAVGRSAYSDPIIVPVFPTKPKNVRLQIVITPP